MHSLHGAVQFARLSLGVFPTPIQQLSSLSEYLGGPLISVKRDDLSGLAFGGNKVRKLEYILAQARHENADTLITAGAIQSNHCRQTAAAAARLNLACHLVLGGEPPSSFNGNLLLDRLFGCHIHWAGEHRKGEDIPMLYEELKAQGNKPYVVPYGGSNEPGVVSFVHAMQELREQAGTVMPYSHIIVASSSGATQAGIMLGNELADQQCEVIGIAIDKSETVDFSLSEKIVMLANNTAVKMKIDKQFTLSDVKLDDNYLGAGYGIVGAGEKEAISLLARTEGILLDPIYTGRAMAGLIDYVKKGKIGRDDHVLFWHTGGLPALFAYADELLSVTEPVWL